MPVNAPLEGPPSIRCIEWEDSEKAKPRPPGSRHARYVLQVNPGDGRAMYQVRKRWQELSDFARDLGNYNKILHSPYRWGDRGEKGLPTKFTAASLEDQPQRARIGEINTFLSHLTGWIRYVAQEAPAPALNLLEVSPDRQEYLNLVATFLMDGAGYDAMRGTLTPEQVAALTAQVGGAAQ